MELIAVKYPKRNQNASGCGLMAGQWSPTRAAHSHALSLSPRTSMCEGLANDQGSPESKKVHTCFTGGQLLNIKYCIDIC